MEIVRLPTEFPGDLDAALLNEQLRSGAVQLDWSAVQCVDETALQRLLLGVDLSDDADQLGVDTMSSAIALQLARIISELPAPPPQKSPRSPAPASRPRRDPELWHAAPPPSEQPLNQDDALPSNITPETMPPDNPMSTDSSSLPPSTQATPSLKTAATVSPNEMRAKLIDLVAKELLGPADGESEEVDERNLSERYLLGCLAARKHEPREAEQAEQQDELATTAADSAEEGQTETHKSGGLFPASMGMSFCVAADVRSILITATWGAYERDESQTITTDHDNPKTVWRRSPQHHSQTYPLNVGSRDLPVSSEYPEIQIRVKCRRLESHDWIVTLFFVNGQTEPATRKETAWVFQPQLTVQSSSTSQDAIFIRHLPRQRTYLNATLQEEQDDLALLYRNSVEFAVGHGVAVTAQTASDDPTRAIQLQTTFLPQYEVPQTTPPTPTEIPLLAGLELDMMVLAEVEPSTLPPRLQPLIAAYGQWIAAQELAAQQPDLLNYQAAADRAIRNMRQALTRIQGGINLLAENPQAAQAFQFANRAMALQRIHGKYAEAQRQGQPTTLQDFERPEHHSWRMFQLAFLLLNLPSATKLDHRARSHATEAVCDLLWFPTGGGKTEAYLGLAAYMIGLRRLQGCLGDRDGEHGVTVLMRYTLRLLTLQQFQRATALMCACESIRREDPQTWGENPFRIGLWVGNKNTPNRTSQSDEIIKQQKGGRYSGQTGSPHQLTNCPWCGHEITANNITVETFEKGKGRTLTFCGDRLGQCLFSPRRSPNEGLPIVVVDEEIYRQLPTLLIATVDKFAQMPWNGATQTLFGQVSGRCERHGFRAPDLADADSHPQKENLPAAKTQPHLKLRPPDLIIQDELHLISGPLGSLVGLYETAIDELCTWELDGQRIRPKVIASTATIRQAKSQIHQLFLRQVQIFPPSGLDISDNFFSRQRPPSPEYPGRVYLGICAPGRRLKRSMIGVYTAALGAGQVLYEEHQAAADPWMTLVGYFNSLRELGGTRRLVDDDIRNRLRSANQRQLAARSLYSIDELTSRKDSTDIPKILDRLSTPYRPYEKRQGKSTRNQRQGKQHQPPPHLDVALATNMISVGVDVPRLGLMVVCGQPKNTAEYIQATSRVGRDKRGPGLVLTVYNWARPRDLSHYESFEHYHATFYQHVEPLSVTPFSSGACDRALTALLVSLVRLSESTFNANDRAEGVKAYDPIVQAAIAAIVHRAEHISGRPVAEAVRAQLNAIADQWNQKADNPDSTLQYTAHGGGDTAVPLLKPPGSGPWETFTCLNSMRNVEPTIGLILNDTPPDDERDRLPQPFIESEP